jgi:hypothetical protein
MTLLECIALWSTCFAIGLAVGIADYRSRHV